MGVVPSTEHPDSCRAPTRERECTCGLGVPPRVGLKRLEAGEEGFLDPGSAVWPFVNRPVCITNKPPVASVLQLEARPFGMGSGRVSSLVGETKLLHVSPLLSDPKMPQRAESREGLGTTSGSGMAQSSLVPSTTESTGGHTGSITITEGHNHGPNGSAPPLSPGGSSSLGRLACVRRQLQSEGLSDGVVNIIRQSWRNSTEAAYSSAWRMWVRWCCGRGGDPVSAPLSEVLEFLLEQYQAGKQYRTINSFRSAISMTHEEVDGTRVGQHPLVARFLKGIFNNRPPAPRYRGTWDTDIVLRHLEGSPDNRDLSLQQLTHKLAMLLALANADRCSNLAALDVDRQCHSSD